MNKTTLWKIVVIIILCLLVAGLFTQFLSCSPAQSQVAPASPIQVTDHLGRTVGLAKYPQRIISLAPGNTEIVYALGLGDRVVGVTNYDEYPPEVKQKAKIGGFSTPDIEKVVALAPDLILAASIHKGKVISDMESRGLTVLVLDPKNLEEVMEAMTLIGEVTGQDKEAAQATAAMGRRIAAVRQLTAGLSPDAKPRVFYIVWHDPLMTAGADTWFNEFINLGGGVNLFSDLKAYPQVNLETVLQRDPQVIVVGSGHGSGGNLSFQWAGAESRLKGTVALKSGRVYPIDADLVSKPGPRLVDGLEAILRLIHPELVKK